MSRFLKSSGAFREFSAFGRDISVFYGECGSCGLVFESRSRIVSLGSYSSSKTKVELESDRIAREKSNQLKIAFDNLSKRCICDLEGDLIFHNKRLEEGARLEQWAKQNSLRNSQSPPIARERTPQPLRPPSPSLKEVLTSKLMRHRFHKSEELSLALQLRQLADLFEAGALTREQFESAKNLLLGK
jgi:hypothetical protein